MVRILIRLEKKKVNVRLFNVNFSGQRRLRQRLFRVPISARPENVTYCLRQ